ncbi:dynamin [Amycolatopsis sp. K13G38]|uniref:Dynamin n=1 Tax=Amycolatopsis acididurans TaxID=2724524 RepID=A0ABX1J0L0_9PSEU|nr:dynamin family protein [Amycolatopsis acididurans]NKQ53159.1 dynamin [Amycolatopsis acididurans]
MSGQQEPSSAVRAALDTLDLAARGSRAYGREDLARRLTEARHLLTEPDITVYVVGEFKQGKSSLINALLTAKVCPVDDDIATAVPTVVRYAGESGALVTYEPADPAAEPWTERITLEQLTSYASEAGNPHNIRKLRSLTASIKRQLLAGGLVLVDTPGVGGLGSLHNAVTVSSLPRAHAVLFLSDASQELTAAELRFLATVRELCPTVLFVLTKTDLYPQWRRILELNTRHLAERGIHIEQLPVSSELRLTAARSADQDLNVESGFPRLVERLQTVVADAERYAVYSAGAHVASAAGQLGAALRTRRTTLTHPERSAGLVTELDRVNSRVDALRSRSARWQQLLADGFADISSDTDYDLRTRSRAVLHEGEQAIDEGDPAKNWPEFEKWLRQRLANETLENYAKFVRDARELAGRIAEHFELAEAQAVLPPEVRAPVGVTDRIAIDSSFTTARARGATGMAAFQKAYSGFLMFSMLTKIATLAIPTPFGLAAGLLLGRTGFLDERRRQLEKRRTLAKNAVRRFVDEFNLQVGKDSRDAMRQVQRELRDAYAARVDELQRSTAEALAAASQAVRDDKAEADELQRLEKDLAALDLLSKRAEELTSRSAPALTAVSR